MEDERESLSLDWEDVDDDPRDRSLADDLRQLIDDGRALADAEFAYQKRRAEFAGQGIKGVAILGALAAALVFFALMALTIGLVLALAPLLTPWGAAGAAFAGLLFAGFICAKLASARWKRLARALGQADKTE